MVNLVCPECGSDIVREDSKLYCKNKHVFNINNGICEFLPKSLHSVTQEDAVYHANCKEDWVNLTQSDSLRNLHFHKKIIEFIANASTSDAKILEIGGGVGFDLELFLMGDVRFDRYCFSEISSEVVQFVKSKVDDKRVEYYTVDAHRIPFKTETFDFIYMIAALHHLVSVECGIREIARVAKKDAYVIFGIEPNKMLFYLLRRAKKAFAGLFPQKDHSAADEQAEGFVIKDFVELGKDCKLELIKVEPVWILCGFVHYGLEFVFRAFKLKTRIRLPFIVEGTFIFIDKLLFLIPGFKYLAWHYTVIYKKL